MVSMPHDPLEQTVPRGWLVKELLLSLLLGFALLVALVLLRSNHPRPGMAPAPASTVYGAF
jgi:hypothetical protein